MTKYNTRRGIKNYGKPFSIPYMTLTSVSYSFPKVHANRGGIFHLASVAGSLTVTKTVTIT